MKRASFFVTVSGDGFNHGYALQKISDLGFRQADWRDNEYEHLVLYVGKDPSVENTLGAAAARGTPIVTMVPLPNNAPCHLISTGIDDAIAAVNAIYEERFKSARAKRS